MSSKKNYLVVLASLALIGGVLLIIAPHAPATPPATTATTTAATSSPSMVAEGSSYVVPVTATGTVMDAMRVYAATGSFTFTSHDYPSLGTFIDSIDGQPNANGKYWILYVNGTSSPTGASATQVTPGDTVEWRYEKSY